jgi:hypothetical protein
MTDLPTLLERVRACKGGADSEAERSAIARDWCALWIERDDYPSLSWLITDALSDHRVAIGSAIVLAERVLPGWSWEVRHSGVGDPGQATVWHYMRQPGTGQDFRVTGMATPALAILAAILSALLEKEKDDGG